MPCVACILAQARGFRWAYAIPPGQVQERKTLPALDCVFEKAGPQAGFFCYIAYNKHNLIMSNQKIKDFFSKTREVEVKVGCGLASQILPLLAPHERSVAVDIYLEPAEPYWVFGFMETAVYVDPMMHVNDMTLWNKQGQCLADFVEKPNVIRWTPQRVLDMQAAQLDPTKHGFTCANQGDHDHLFNTHVLLVPTVRGWICPFCDYTQTH